MPLEVGELIARDGSACVWCGREVWLRDLTREQRALGRLARSPRRMHRDAALRQLRRLDSV